MSEKEFKGDKKAPMRSPLAKAEKRLIDALTPHFPQWIQSYQLTLLTLPESLGLILFGYLAAAHDVRWLWGSSVMLFLQWFTDSFDGSLGRYREMGLAKWGFHMDHFLDFFFMPCIFIGYVFLMAEPLGVYLLLALGFIYAMLMVNSFLDFGATGNFKITYLGTGPTEVRLYFIILNVFLILHGPAWFEAALPYALGLSVSALVFVVHRTQKRIWDVDMRIKRESDAVRSASLSGA